MYSQSKRNDSKKKDLKYYNEKQDDREKVVLDTLRNISNAYYPLSKNQLQVIKSQFEKTNLQNPKCLEEAHFHKSPLQSLVDYSFLKKWLKQ